ncbi:histidine kinase [Fulvitalea axinellae]|uniref:Histidine kinase n=1 Tax=Fulvitalea axinellae TaxID=1182444 RepID=A0AAU9CTD2_9BACT|nr:histidine kinase [Fulvitalea axinellae]
MKTDDELYRKAHRRVMQMKGFYTNLASYLIILAFLAIINVNYDPQNLWVGWVALGWGLGIVFHGIKVFGDISLLGRDWEDKQLRKIIEKEKKRNGGKL